MVAHAGDWRPAVATLLEPKCLQGCPQKIEGKEKNPPKDLRGNPQKDDLPIGVDVYNYSSTGHVAATLNANCFSKNSHGPKILDHKGFRIHTPEECEFLQGFENGYTNIPFHTRSQSKHEQLRMKALGNSMAVPMMHWIGKRIDTFEQTVKIG